MLNSEVYIYFSGNGQTVSLPINPSSVKIETQGRNITEEIVGLGEINILRKPALKEVTISSYFPKSGTFDPVSSFRTENIFTKSANTMVRFFENAYINKKPLKMVITRLNLSAVYGIESFSRENKAGEHDDIYFEMRLKEWRPYGVIVMQRDSEGNLVKGKSLQNDPEFAVDNKKIPTAVKVLTGETSIWAEAQKATGSGDNWEAIYNASKDVLGSGLDDLTGKIIKIPAEITDMGVKL